MKKNEHFCGVCGSQFHFVNKILKVIESKWESASISFSKE
jgi:hypothetical protein